MNEDYDITYEIRRCDRCTAVILGDIAYEIHKNELCPRRLKHDTRIPCADIRTGCTCIHGPVAF